MDILTLSKKYDDLYAKIYSSKQTRGLELGIITFILNKIKKGSTLDIGCGFGEIMTALKNKGFEIKGITISKTEVKFNHSRGLEVIYFDANKPLEYRDNSFQTVLSIGSLEHLYNWSGCLDEIKRILCQGGSFIVYVPNRIFGKTCKEEWSDWLHPHEFLYFELKHELERRFKEVDFHLKVRFNHKSKFRYLFKIIPESFDKILFPFAPYLLAHCKK